MATLKSLAQIYAALRFNSRIWQVLQMHVDEGFTLEKIANSVGGISRERVRQIEKKAWTLFMSNSMLVIPVFNAIEQGIKSAPTTMTVGQVVGREILASNIATILNANDFVIEVSEAQRFILLTRALVSLDPEIERKSLIEDCWPRFSYLACKLDPPIKRHLQAAKSVRREAEKGKKLSYKEIAHQILAKEQKPLHWSEIVNRAYPLRGRNSFNSTALYNSLLRNSDAFVRVSAGTYGLQEWGLSEVDYYPDIIAAILKSEKRALPIMLIFPRVNEKRPIKKATLTMLLDMHPRFYKSLENSYGLRGWLLPREQQTLRTPEWLVEAAVSLKRLEQAAQRGYDVEGIIQGDIN